MYRLLEQSVYEYTALSIICARIAWEVHVRKGLFEYICVHADCKRSLYMSKLHGEVMDASFKVVCVWTKCVHELYYKMVRIYVDYTKKDVALYSWLTEMSGPL